MHEVRVPSGIGAPAASSNLQLIGCRSPLPLPCRYLRWLQEGIPPAQAYIERSAVHHEARCYLQARADARAAIALLLAEQRQQGADGQQQQQQQAGQQTGTSSANGSSGASGNAGSSADCRSQLALAYQRLAQAFIAEPDHPDRDCRCAAKAFLRAMEALADRSSGLSAFSGGDSSLDAELESVVRNGLEEASKELTIRQLDEVGARVGAWVGAWVVVWR